MFIFKNKIKINQKCFTHLMIYIFFLFFFKLEKIEIFFLFFKKAFKYNIYNRLSLKTINNK